MSGTLFNKVAGTVQVQVHPLKLNIYTLTPISFKPFALSKLNVICIYQKSVIFNGRLRQTRYLFLTEKITSISFSCLLQLSKSLFKVKCE